MFAFELLARLRHLCLSGKNEDGDLEWIGSYKDWVSSEEEKKKILAEHEFKKIWR